MDIERETIVEAVSVIVPAIVTIVALVAVGANYGSESGLSRTGGQAVVMVLAGFVLLVTIVGLVLARR